MFESALVGDPEVQLLGRPPSPSRQIPPCYLIFNTSWGEPVWSKVRDQTEKLIKIKWKRKLMWKRKSIKNNYRADEGTYTYKNVLTAIFQLHLDFPPFIWCQWKRKFKEGDWLTWNMSPKYVKNSRSNTAQVSDHKSLTATQTIYLLIVATLISDKTKPHHRA